MHVFLTGASGFIGSHVLSLLLERGHRVVALSRSGRNTPHLRGIDHDCLAVCEGDATLMTEPPPVVVVTALNDYNVAIIAAGSRSHHAVPVILRERHLAAMISGVHN